jgi:hypothetical protein
MTDKEFVAKILEEVKKHPEHVDTPQKLARLSEMLVKYPTV